MLTPATAIPPALPVWLPFEPGPYRMAMGLMARPLSALTAFGADYPAQMAERRNLLDTRHDEVFGTIPGYEAARAELLRVIVDHLLADRAEWFAMAGGMLENHLTGERWNVDAPAIDPLELAGRLVQEDLCLLNDEAPPRLIAAVLCFPSRWRLSEKLGRPLAAVHGPVPLYEEKLARPVDRFIGALAPGRMVERFNWSVHEDAALFQPVPPAPDAFPPVTDDDVGTRLVLRVERQTLSRLPESRAVLFTIRTQQTPLAEVMALPGAAADLAAAIRALPDAVAGHKCKAPFRDTLLAALDRISPPR